MKIRNNREIVPLPFWVYRIEMVSLVLLGLYVSIHLTYTHYANYNILSYQSFCALSKSINCDTVAQSRFSIFMGVPVAVWGIVGYLFMLSVLLSGFLPRIEDSRSWPLLFVLSVTYSMVSLIYGYISIKFIRSICILCLISYAVNFSSLLVSWITIRRYSLQFWFGIRDDFRFYWHTKKKALPLGIFFLSAVLCLLFFYPPYWNFPGFPKSSLFHHGLTQDGHPWIGAKNPRLIITEFTDYQCFPCKKAHLALRKLVQQYPDKIRLVHRHFPMGTQCNPLVKGTYHEAACTMALIAICAGNHGQFWPTSDSLFYHDQSKNSINAKKMVEHFGLDFESICCCIRGSESFGQLLHDIREGLELGVRVTPSFIIDDQLYAGHIPTDVLNRPLKEIVGK